MPICLGTKSILSDINHTANLWFSILPWRPALYFQHLGWIVFIFFKPPSAPNLVILVVSIWGRNGSKTNEMECNSNKVVNNHQFCRVLQGNAKVFMICFWILGPERGNSINFALKKNKNRLGCGVGRGECHSFCPPCKLELRNGQAVWMVLISELSWISRKNLFLCFGWLESPPGSNLPTWFEGPFTRNLFVNAICPQLTLFLVFFECASRVFNSKHH